MKTLVFVLLVFLSPLLLAQQGGIDGNGTNDWFFIPDFFPADSSGTYTYSNNGFQGYRSAGNTITLTNGINFQFQTTWRKEFWESYPIIPDTFVLRVKYIQGENVVNAYIGMAIQDSSSFSWRAGKEINLDNEWQEIKFDMSHQKTFMSNFGRFYLIFEVATVESCYVWYENGVDYVKGIDDTLGIIMYDDFGGVVGVEEETSLPLPTEFTLEQNYPNPFNPSTTIRFTISQREEVILIVFNSLGQEIKTLTSGEKDIGNYEVFFDASDLPSGVYFYKLQAGSFVETKKMLMIK